MQIDGFGRKNEQILGKINRFATCIRSPLYHAGNKARVLIFSILAYLEYVKVSTHVLKHRKSLCDSI